MILLQVHLRHEFADRPDGTGPSAEYNLVVERVEDDFVFTATKKPDRKDYVALSSKYTHDCESDAVEDLYSWCNQFEAHGWKRVTQ